MEEGQGDILRNSHPETRSSGVQVGMAQLAEGEIAPAGECNFLERPLSAERVVSSALGESSHGWSELPTSVGGFKVRRVQEVLNDINSNDD